MKKSKVERMRKKAKAVADLILRSPKFLQEQECGACLGFAEYDHICISSSASQLNDRLPRRKEIITLNAVPMPMSMVTLERLDQIRRDFLAAYQPLSHDQMADLRNYTFKKFIADHG